MTVEEILKAEDAFAECARVIKEGGIDAVQLHCLHRGLWSAVFGEL